MRRLPRSSSAPFGASEGGEPDEVLEFASQAVEYVRRSLGVTLEYDSETLPVLDHYLRQVLLGPDSGGSARAPKNQTPGAVELVAATSGAYFGEVVRRRLGGAWQLPSSDPGSWRLVLPSGLWFFPTAMAMAAILGPDGVLSDLEGQAESEPNADLDADPDADPDDDDEADADLLEWDATIQAPALLRPYVARVLHGMADVSEEEYYSLCCRLDTLEHVQAVLAAMASTRRSHRDPGPD
jgi:hypothetical protein